MEMAPKPFSAPKRVSVSDAKLAYFEGDFERCLEICTSVTVRTVAIASELALLTARAYLRTGRPHEARVAILQSLETHSTLDASLTAQMLLASAHIRGGDPDTGIAILTDTTTLSPNAHVAVRSEIAFTFALAHWAKRDIDRAESYLAQVDPGSDIIHARALELQAWCQTARRDYRRSAECFRLTLLRLDECQARDRAIAATALSTLAIYSAELFDRDLARFVDQRAAQMDWSSGLTVQHYLTLSHQALFHEFAGNTVDAYHFATQAREHAPTVPFEVMGWALSSAIARNASEAYSAIVYAQRAQVLLETLDVRELSGEERFAMLTVAESCAHFAPDRAAELFAAYWGLAPVDQMLSLAGDPRLTADETLIEGTIAEHRAERDRAVRCYRKAYELFRSIGYTRRALIAAQALLKLEPADAALREFMHDELAGTTNFMSRALAAQASPDRLASLDRHPVIAGLPRVQREVVILICHGKTNKEIANQRNVGEQTIKNMLTKHIFPAFGVSSRAALVSEILRR
jgi:ATP/maltotriose-dependent transcriptional regulator MalT